METDLCVGAVLLIPFFSLLLFLSPPPPPSTFCLFVPKLLETKSCVYYENLHFRKYLHDEAKLAKDPMSHSEHTCRQ